MNYSQTNKSSDEKTHSSKKIYYSMEPSSHEKSEESDIFPRRNFFIKYK